MKVSIVATTFNRSVQMRRGLVSILNQDNLPEELEIVLVDDGSVDDTKEIVDTILVPLAQEKQVNFKYVYLDHPEHRISSIPRNVGIKNAEGEVIIFTESEMLHVGDTVAQILKKMEEEPARTPVATQIWSMGRRIWEKISEEDYRYPSRIINHRYAMLVEGNMQNTKAPDADFGITGSNNCFTGAYFAVRKQWLMDLGGFDETFEGHGWDDWDLLHRLNVYGKGVLYCNDIIVIHQWHEKNYPYNTIDAGKRNGTLSEANLKKGLIIANKGKDWGQP